MIIPINTTYSRALIAVGREKDYFVASLSIGLSNIVLNLFLVPKMGITGAAWSKIGAEFIGYLYSYHSLSRIMKIELTTKNVVDETYEVIQY